MSQTTPPSAPPDALLTLRGIRIASLYKLSFIGLMCSFVPLGLLLGVMAWIGFDTVQWQGTPVSGPAGVVVGLLAGLWAALAFTLVLGSLQALGLWLWTRFRPIRLWVRLSDGVPVRGEGAGGADSGPVA